MRGNHIHWFRNDYTPPPALSAESLQRVDTVTVRLREGTNTWWEAWLDGVLIGYVRTVMHGQYFRGLSDNGWMATNLDWLHSEPPHARAILALLDHLDEALCTEASTDKLDVATA